VRISDKPLSLADPDAGRHCGRVQV
jgi:hypothetical protein